MTTRTSLRPALFAALLLCGGLQHPALAHAQGSAQVQMLYGEAKAAESSGDLPGAIAKYKQLVQVAPRLAPAFSNLGMLYLRTQQYGDAVAALKHARALDPALPSVAPLLGIAYYQMGDLAEARVALQAAVKANPADTNAASLLAKVLLHGSDLPAAVTQLQQLAAREPNNQQLWFELGQAYMQLSQQAFQKVQAIDPNSVLVHELSGQMMVDMRNYDGALVQYKKAVEMAPAEPGTHFGLAMVYWDQNNLPAALSEFRSELDNDPGNCEARAKVGSILLAQQQPADALDEANRVLAHCPTLLEARVVQGEALVQGGKNAEGIAALRAVVATDPGDTSVHFYLARAYRASGDKEEAQAELVLYSKLQAAEQEHTAAEAQQVIDAKSQP